MMMKKWLMLFLVSFFAFLKLTADEEKVMVVAKRLNVYSLDPIKIEKISGGLSNTNYKVTIGDQTYFFRDGNREQAPLNSSIHREWQITTMVSKIALGPEVILYSAEDNILVTEFIQPDKNEVDLKNLVTIRKVCSLFSTLHQLIFIFPTEYDPILSLKEDIEKAKNEAIELPLAFDECILPKIHSLEKMEISCKKTPAHLDLHKGNILNHGSKLYLIDWEYAAMSDPFFDLATLASTEQFSDGEMEIMLWFYLEREPTQREYDHLYQMRFLADARWALWSYIQAKISPLDEPYQKMGEEFLLQSLKRL